MKLFKNKNICHADNSKNDCSTIQTIRDLQKELNNIPIPKYKQPSDFLSEIKYFEKGYLAETFLILNAIAKIDKNILLSISNAIDDYIAYNDIYTKKLQEKDKLEKRIKEEKDKLGIQ